MHTQILTHTHLHAYTLQHMCRGVGQNIQYPYRPPPNNTRVPLPKLSPPKVCMSKSKRRRERDEEKEMKRKRWRERDEKKEMKRKRWDERDEEKEMRRKRWRERERKTELSARKECVSKYPYRGKDPQDALQVSFRKSDTYKAPLQKDTYNGKAPGATRWVGAVWV